MSVTVTNERAAPFDVTADGVSLLTETQLIELRVEQTVAMADRAVLRFADPDLSIVDGETLSPGTSLSVTLGAAHNTDSPAEVFTGEVVSLEAEMGPSGVHVLVVALDKSHRLRRTTNTKAYNDVTVGDIARTIMSTHGVEVGTIADSSTPRDIVFQDGESDWQLLERLFDEEGCEMNIVSGTFEARSRTAAGNPVALTLGTTLRSFHPRLSGAAQVSSVEVRSWDPSLKQVISGTALLSPSVTTQAAARDSTATALGGGSLVVVDHPAASAGVASTIATAIARKLGTQVIEASAIALGDPKITAGRAVSLSGVGTRFGGEHRVVSATHILRGSRGYETRLQLGAGGEPLLGGAGRPSTTRSAVGGGFAAHLAIGIVTQNDDDEKQARVKVKFPALDDLSESSWIRVAWPAAGQDRGIVALPSIGDEVIIGFEHGDIERPIVLGALFNGQDTPGTALPSSAAPQTVAITAPGDVVTTATGKITTSSTDDLSLSSEGAVTLAGQGEGGLKVTSNGTMELTAQETQKLGGLTTTVQGTTQALVTSDASVQIKSNGEVLISGATITINASGALMLQGSVVMLG